MSEELATEVLEVKEGDGAAAVFSQGVKDLIAASGPRVREQVKEHLVKKAIDERAELVLKGLDKRSSLMRDLNKCRPDVKSVSGDGKKDERYSEAKWKEKSDLEDKLKKLNAAMESALAETPNYEPLRKAVG